jgi:chemotaxis protein CheD
LKRFQSTVEEKKLLSLKAKIGFQTWYMPKRVLAYQTLELPTSNANLKPEMEEVRVDMAAMKVESKNVELVTSVGSCIAICLHDPVHRCGGLAHIMLPNSAIAPQESLPSKFANTAVPALASEIRQVSGKHARLSAKIAGGANMFASIGTNGLDIGAKNIKAVKAALSQHNIWLAGEDVGGLQGRRINFNVNSGSTLVKHFNGEIIKL